MFVLWRIFFFALTNITSLLMSVIVVAYILVKIEFLQMIGLLIVCVIIRMALGKVLRYLENRFFDLAVTAQKKSD